MDSRPGLVILCVSLLSSGGAWAQSDSVSVQQQETSLQAQITQGLNNGTLSGSQVESLEQRLQALQVGNANANIQDSGLGRVGTPAGETITPLATNGHFAPGATAIDRNQATTRAAGPVAPTTTQTTTGPDPFTYNSLGPDAYQSQKYKNPEYNVPAYPTTNPQPTGLDQQYTQPSAGAPYGAGYGQAPYAGAAATNGQQGVYVYRPNAGR